MMIGAHVSIAGGIEKSIPRGTALGGSAIQTFASSPRMMRFAPYSSHIVEEYNRLKDAFPSFVDIRKENL